MWVFAKGAFVQLIRDSAEHGEQLWARMTPIEIHEWVFSFWDRVKDLRKKGLPQGQ